MALMLAPLDVTIPAFSALSFEAEEVGEQPSLHQAVQCGDLEAVLSLIKDGVDVNTQFAQHRSCRETALMEAANTGDVEIVQAIVDAGANVNFASPYNGRTALMVAAKADHHAYPIPFRCDTLKFLLAAGADVRAVDHAGNTALDLAVAAGYAPVVEVLILGGASVENVHPRAIPPLVVAIKKKRRDLVNLLIANGANVNFESSHGALPLLAAVKCGMEDIVDDVLAAGANVDAQSMFGLTAMLMAMHWRPEGTHDPPPARRVDENRVFSLTAEHEFFQESYISALVRRFLHAGADVNRRLQKQETPTTVLEVAADCHKGAPMCLLLDAGAKLPTSLGEEAEAAELNRALVYWGLHRGDGTTSMKALSWNRRSAAVRLWEQAWNGVDC
jgi:ankyrin repeat protein